MRLKKRLIRTLLIAAFFPLVIIVGIVCAQTQISIQHQTQESDARMANQVAETLRVAIGKAGDLMTIAYKNKWVNAYLQGLDRTSYEYAQTYSEMVRALTDILPGQEWKNSAYLYNFTYKEKFPCAQRPLPAFTPQEASFMEKAWVRRVIDKKGMLSVISSEGDENSSLVIARTFIDVLNNTVLGIIALELDENFLRQHIDASVFRAGVCLYDENGNLVVSSLPTGKKTNVVYASYEPFGMKVGVQTRDWTAETLIASLTPVILGFLGMLVFIVLYATIEARKLSRPIEVLGDKMKSISQGRFDERMAVNKAPILELNQLEIGFNTMSHDLQRLVETEFRLKLEASKAQYYALQAQIHPHMLFNTLTTMYAQAEEQGNQDVCQMIKHLANLFRYIVRKGDDTVTLGEELDHIGDYLAIHRVRYEESLVVWIHDYEKFRMLPALRLSLQPLIENALEHSIVPNKGGSIEIRTEVTQNACVVSVINSGVPLTPEGLEKIRDAIGTPDVQGDYHIGLKNVHSRVCMKFPGSQGIKASILSDGRTNISLTWSVTNESPDRG